MSTLNMHPPQTYSRLFRPWDTNRTTSIEKPAVPIAAVQMTAVKTECCSPEPSTSANHSIKTEEEHNTSSNGNSNSSMYMSNDSDRDECGSSSGDSSQSSSSPMPSPSSGVIRRRNLLHHQHAHHPYAPATGSSYSASLQLYSEAMESRQSLHPSMDLPPMSSSTTSPVNAAASNDYYYAAAAAAAAAAANGSHPAAFGMDPYTLGLMEQEYARVMAEDAQLKALNARKQRPKKFKCPHCDVAFSNNGQLKGHIRIHTGERPFKCDVETCGKTFTRNEELTRHKRIHTGLRPYPCSVCGKKFGRRDHLKKHMKTHLPQERQLAPAIFVPLYPYLYGY